MTKDVARRASGAERFLKAIMLAAGFVGLVALMRQTDEQPRLTDAPVISQEPAVQSPVIRVLSDANGIYTAELVTKMTDGLAHIVSKRVGSSGTTYTKRECKCAAATYRTLGSGDTLDRMQSSPMDPKHTPLVMGPDGMGSSAFHVCQYACAAIGSRLKRINAQ